MPPHSREVKLSPDEPTDVARQGGTVAGMTMLSRISGLARDVVLSYVFGATQYADMFFVAFRIPNFFRRLFAEGAFNQAFVPVLVRFKERSHAALLQFITPLSGIFAAAVTLFVLLGVLAAPWLTALFAPGFVGDPEVYARTTELVRITFPYLGFISLTAYAGALLNSHNHFAIPAFTPVLLNLTLIVAAIIALTLTEPAAAPDLNRSVVVLAWGVLVAGGVQLLFQVPSLARLRVLPRPSLDHRHTGVRQVGKLLVPAVLAASVGQINALVNTILASTLMTGSISWLYYADRLLELPVGLVAVALGTVMLPHLSRLAAAGDDAAFKRTLDWGVSLGLMLGAPSAVALFLLAEPLLATLFMSFGGAMTPGDVRMAGYALQMFAVALPGFVLVKILAPAFFAEQDTRSPFRYATGAVAANLIGSLATFTWFGHVGLAWATAVSAWVHVALLYYGLKKRGLYRAGVELLPMFARVLAASVVLAAAVWWWAVPIEWLEMDALNRVLGIGVVVLCGVVLYTAVLFLSGVRPRDLRHHA